MIFLSIRILEDRWDVNDKNFSCVNIENKWRSARAFTYGQKKMWEWKKGYTVTAMRLGFQNAKTVPIE